MKEKKAKQLCFRTFSGAGIRTPLKRLYALFLVLVLAVSLSAPAMLPVQAASSDPDYADAANWAYNGIGENKSADLFVIGPSVFRGSDTVLNMSLQDEAAKYEFLGELNMGQGIYSDTCRMYAPYYRQASLSAYGIEQKAEEKGSIPGSTEHTGTLSGNFNLAYQDVKSAFVYYLNHRNNGRLFVLAGFSQGSEMVLRLLEDFGKDPQIQKQLVAAYMIGWRVTQQDIDRHPYLKMAQNESDTGVIVSFNSEDPTVTESLLVPEGVRTLSINPLNWKTDSTPADKSQNLGACFTGYSGEVQEEIPQMTGAYIDPVRGTLKVTDIREAMYPPQIAIFGPGVYHLYDCMFFYRNLQKNVAVRTAAKIAETAEQ